MKYDISVLIPGIRTMKWPFILNSLAQSCTRYSYEVVFVGPYDPPKEILNEKVKFMKTYRCPSSALQLGAQSCEGELICHLVDDSKFVPHAVDKAVDLYKRTCGYKDVVNLRYTEDVNHSGKSLPPEFWTVRHHKLLRLRGIPKHYKTSLQFLINASYFLELGGLDCSYEYINFNVLDLMFRIQHDGGVLQDSPTEVALCDYLKERIGDHGPIHDAYFHDLALFQKKYSKRNALRDNPVRIDINNWKYHPEIWNRRFKEKLFTSYEEMMQSFNASKATQELCPSH